jgi:hypothetical protein
MAKTNKFKAIEDAVKNNNSNEEKKSKRSRNSIGIELKNNNVLGSKFQFLLSKKRSKYLG